MVVEERSLSALLSQLLVAFTVEFDNEFERRMYVCGHPGERLSLVVWTNLMRFLVVNPVSVRGLAAQALVSEKQVRFELGCLERWGFVILHSNPAGPRDGWGSARGIRAGWLVCVTSKGVLASEIWPPLFGLIEQRWQQRLGTREMIRLRRALSDIEREDWKSNCRSVCREVLEVLKGCCGSRRESHLTTAIFLCPLCSPACSWRSGLSSMPSRHCHWCSVQTPCACWGLNQCVCRTFHF
jgi:hypothetical protein